ncbi:MAG: HAD-IA family hydrolase [Clostridia bacterium]|nr:HAD-IA family hydrolase [Clostridia bacterium]
MIDVILWDLDGTLLDFRASEKNAIRDTFRHFRLGELTDADIARYSEINFSWWTRMERGKVTKPQVLDGRFVDFFRLMGVAFSDLDAFNEYYQTRLGDAAVPFPGAFETVAEMKRRGKRQFLVTNGTAGVQRARLRICPLGELLDGAFISEDIGYEKPSPLFFEAVFRGLGPCDRRRVMIVGDSLSGDMKGGRDAGIVTCLYRPKGGAPHSPLVDHVIQDLSEVTALCETAGI